MELRTIGQTSEPKAPVMVPVMHGLVVAPVVGSIVLLFVAVGFAAMAFGAYSGFVRHRRARQPHRRGPRQDTAARPGRIQSLLKTTTR